MNLTRVGAWACAAAQNASSPAATMVRSFISVPQHSLGERRQESAVEHLAGRRYARQLIGLRDLLDRRVQALVAHVADADLPRLGRVDQPARRENQPLALRGA